jgi:hypothetical protein
MAWQVLLVKTGKSKIRAKKLTPVHNNIQMKLRIQPFIYFYFTIDSKESVTAKRK